MNIRVTQVPNTQVSVRPVEKPFKVRLETGGVEVAAKFTDLEDFDATGLTGDYVVVYDGVTRKFKTVPADTVLTFASADDDLPDEFVQDIADELHMDGGSF
jgi:hypothetical protein|tara:strand:+ start:162 stop:464 length:303 start_codon:yes stop_codon:yes gene_type:complete